MNPPEFTLRAATPADEPFLFALRKATMTEHLERAGESTDEHTHWERLRYRYGDAYVICCGSEKLGLFKFFRDVDEWTIVQIQILPEHQGRGIAAHLLGEFLSHADDAHVPVKLSVLKGNRAISLYQRFGFHVVDATDTSLLMRRR
ncbi:GNAT family N-acetyltransferase [Paraburkholderia sp. BR10936]|uniref:GNAT family N-acetyltransferase n=1 Tax=Paraburkholderia sp. BR10936 TaxID=3236993 RepID=UPI0034D30D47